LLIWKEIYTILVNSFFINLPFNFSIIKVCENIWPMNIVLFSEVSKYFQHLSLGNCDIDFLNFQHCQVQNFEISNLYEWNQNLGVIFQKYQKQNRKSTKYFTTIVKSCNFLLNSVKVRKIKKILLKWVGKTDKYCLNFFNFHSCTEKWLKVGQLLSRLTKNYGIPQRFSQS
jgi:hypothetical protein